MDTASRARHAGGSRIDAHAGEIANLLLLNVNPLEDIRNTEKIESVVFQGRLLSRTDLDRLLEASLRMRPGRGRHSTGTNTAGRCFSVA
jgi:hypothetical protein